MSTFCIAMGVTVQMHDVRSDLQSVKDCCSGVDLPPELQQNVIHLVHHLLPDSPPGFDGLEALQQLECSISAAQLPGMYIRNMFGSGLVSTPWNGIAL